MFFMVAAISIAPDQIFVLDPRELICSPNLYSHSPQSASHLRKIRRQDQNRK